MVNLLIVMIYIAFISLGLPDALLGAAWPIMQGELSVPVSYAGILSLIISTGTVISSLLSDRMTKWLGCGKVTAISVAITAVALFGFSCSDSYWILCLWAIPYGLGAGSVDAALNNYVALHYASRFESVLSAAATQALRIIVPDYAERAQMMCEEAYARLYTTGVYYGNDDGFGIHPGLGNNVVQGLDTQLLCTLDAEAFLFIFAILQAAHKYNRNPLMAS